MENEDVVRLLLERGADIDEKDNEGQTALMLAAAVCRKSEIPALLEQWAEKLEQQKARELAAELADFSPALKRDIPASRPLKIFRPKP